MSRDQIIAEKRFQVQGHSSIEMTLDTYSHVAPGLQEAVAARFDEFIAPKHENEAVRKDH